MMKPEQYEADLNVIFEGVQYYWHSNKGLNNKVPACEICCFRKLKGICENITCHLGYFGSKPPVKPVEQSPEDKLMSDLILG